jgi:hypothetical protein
MEERHSGVEQVVEMDSLYNASGSTFAFPRDLNLNDMFFGFRINPDIVKDEQGSLKLATGEQGSATQYQSSIGSLPHWSIRRVRTR